MIVLIQPMTNIFDAGKSRPTPPLSLLAAARLAAARHEVRIVDQRATPHWRRELETLLRAKPLLVGVTSVTGSQLDHALAAARFVHQTAPQVPLVWGGIHATLFPEQVLADPAADLVIRGEGEHTLAQLADALAEGRGPHGIAGVSYRDNGQVRHADDRSFVDLDAMPDVDLSLAPGGDHFLVEGRPATYVETSRGCPNRCAYCYNAVFHHRRWRGEKPATVLDRWRRLRRERPHIVHLSIVDDNFFGNPKRALDLAEGLVREGAPFRYQVQGAEVAMLDGFDDDQLALLRRSGCVRLDMGVESGSARLLESVDKRLSPDQVRRVNRRLAACGITAWYNFLAGMPGETDADLDASFALMLQLLRDNPQALVSPFYLYAPYPGTALFERSQELGYRPPARLDGWAGLHDGRLAVPWIDPARRRELAGAYFASIFVDRKLAVYDTKPLFRLAARLYRPIARWRLTRRFFRWMPERWLFEKLVDVS